MENTPPLGPLPVETVPPGLSASRRTVLALLHEQSVPTPLADLVELTGLHENTLRGHLEGLARQGLVRRERAAPEGRGRPAWLWTAVPAEQHSEYAGLAGTLAATLHRTSSDPTGDARLAGEEWGRDLAAGHPRTATKAGEPARAQVIALLDDLGFAPEQGPEDGRKDGRKDGREDGVRLTRCPLLEAARRHPEIVCHVHEGLVTGALEAYGDHTTAAELQPFAEPGACLLFLRDGGRA